MTNSNFNATVADNIAKSFFLTSDQREDTLEKGNKDIHKLEKKVITDKNGKKTVVYVRHNIQTGEKHEFSAGHQVKFQHKGEEKTGIIKTLSHNEKTGKYGNADIVDEKGNKYSKSLPNIEHHKAEETKELSWVRAGFKSKKDYIEAEKATRIGAGHKEIEKTNKNIKKEEKNNETVSKDASSMEEMFKKYGIKDDSGYMKQGKRSTVFDTQRGDYLSNNTNLKKVLSSVPALKNEGYEVEVKQKDYFYPRDQHEVRGEREWSESKGSEVDITVKKDGKFVNRFSADSGSVKGENWMNGMKPSQYDLNQNPDLVKVMEIVNNEYKKPLLKVAKPEVKKEVKEEKIKEPTISDIEKEKLKEKQTKILNDNKQRLTDFLGKEKDWLERLDDNGYSSKHSAQITVKKAFTDFKTIANHVINKLGKKYELRFDSEFNMKYLEGELNIGFSTSDLREEFPKEYEDASPSLSTSKSTQFGMKQGAKILNEILNGGVSSGWSGGTNYHTVVGFNAGNDYPSYRAKMPKS